MTRTVVTIGLLAAALAACSDPATPSPETAAPPPATAPAAADASKAGAGLIGEVSSLSGEVTAFRVTRTATATVVELAADVLFAFDRADLSPQGPAQLQRAADLIRQGGSGPIEVRGYTDSMGEDAYNLDLSQRRSAAVADWLSASGGIEAARLQPRGFGEADPVAPNAGTEGNDYPEGRAMNRRVTIVIPRA